jgi:hypothetical protein
VLFRVTFLNYVWLGDFNPHIPRKTTSYGGNCHIEYHGLPPFQIDFSVILSCSLESHQGPSYRDFVAFRWLGKSVHTHATCLMSTTVLHGITWVAYARLLTAILMDVLGVTSMCCVDLAWLQCVAVYTRYVWVMGNKSMHIITMVLDVKLHLAWMVMGMQQWEVAAYDARRVAADRVVWIDEIRRLLCDWTTLKDTQTE